MARCINSISVKLFYLCRIILHKYIDSINKIHQKEYFVLYLRIFCGIIKIRKWRISKK